MKNTFVCLIIMFIISLPAYTKSGDDKPRTVKLTLHPAQAPQPKDKYQLIPKEGLSDADALPLYKKAIQSLPDNLQRDKVSKWAKTPVDKLPQEQVQSVLQRLTVTLQLVEQAAKCKQCKWSTSGASAQAKILGEYPVLAQILGLQARLQIAQCKYDKAINTIQTGFAMAKHLGKSPDVIHGLLGIAISGLMFGQIEEFIQAPVAPNLYWSLRALPKPFIDLTKQAEWEMPDTENKIRLLMIRLDRHLDALQCLEALRLYAAANNGKFPDNLADITEVTVPDDSITEKPFIYHRTGSHAVLEGPSPKGGTAKDAIRYELNLKE